MTSTQITNLSKMMRYKYNIYIDTDKLEKVYNTIIQSGKGKKGFKDINMICEAFFGIDFMSLYELSSQEDCLIYQEDKCSITQKLQAKIISLERETNQKIKELNEEIEVLKLTNEELRTSYWNLKHNV